MKTEMKVLIALLSVCCLFSGIEVLDNNDAVCTDNVEDGTIDEFGYLYDTQVLDCGPFKYKAQIGLLSETFIDYFEDQSLSLADIDYVSVQTRDDEFKVLSVNPTYVDGQIDLENYEIIKHGDYYITYGAKIYVALNVEYQSAVYYIPKIAVPLSIKINFEIESDADFTYNGISQSVLGTLMLNDTLVNALKELSKYEVEVDKNGHYVPKDNGQYLEFTSGKSGINAGNYLLTWEVHLEIAGKKIDIPGSTHWEIKKKNLNDIYNKDNDPASLLNSDYNFKKDHSTSPISYNQLIYTGKYQCPIIYDMWDVNGNNDLKSVWNNGLPGHTISECLDVNVEKEKNVGLYSMTVSLPGSLEDGGATNYSKGATNYYGTFYAEWQIYKATITSSDVKFYVDSFRAVPANPVEASKITIEKNGELLVEKGVVKNASASFIVYLNDAEDAFIVEYEDDNYTSTEYYGHFTIVAKITPQSIFKCVEKTEPISCSIIIPFSTNIVTLDGILLVNTIKLNGPITKETFDNKVFIYALGYVLDPEDYTLSVNDGWGRTILVDDEPGEINTTSSELNHIVLKGNENMGYTGTLEGWFRVTPDVGYEFSQGGLVYKVTSLSSKTLSVIGYEDGITDVKIPATVDNPIGDNGFKVTRIADKAFYTCTDLQSIDLGSVTNVGLKAFANCVSIESADLSSVKYIGAYSFFRCTGLTSVSFSDGLKSIGKSAFSGVSFDGKSAAVGDLAGKKFVGADGKLKLDNKGIVNGTEFSVDSLVYTVTDAKKKIAAVSGYEGEIITVAVPATVEYDGATFAVKSIADNAFKGCKTLKSIDVSNVESIGFKAFANCDSLQYIDLVGEVKYIGAYAFFGCSALKMVDFGDGLKTIGTGAFGGITFVDASGKTISQSVSKLKGHIFAGSEKVLKLVA